MYVDDYFPILSQKDKNTTGNRVYFSEPSLNEIWLQILEKAYAKYEGGYSNILNGDIVSEIGFFTGAVSHKFNVKELPEELSWRWMLSATNNSAIVISGFNDHEDKKDSKSKKMGHYTYTVLSCAEFYEDGEIIQIIKMKNPSGDFKWLGNYSSKSANWTEELKKFCDYENSFNEVGVFFLDYEEFCTQFDFFVVAYVN